MPCATAAPTEATAWVEVAECLAPDRPHAALVAWRHAIAADASLGTRWSTLHTARELAHATGDDALLVDLAGPLLDDPRSFLRYELDIVGHVRAAQSGTAGLDERDVLLSVPPVSCRYGVAQYRLAGAFAAAGDPAAERRALEAVSRAPTGWSPVEREGARHLVLAARVQLAATAPVPLASEDLQPLLGGLPGQPYASYLSIWSDLPEEEAGRRLRSVRRVLPEAVAADPAPDAVRYWTRVRSRLVELSDDLAADPGGARLAAPRGLRTAAYAAAGMAPLSTAPMRAWILRQEARRSRRDPVARALVAEARAENQHRTAAQLADLVARGIARIDGALGAPTPTGPHHYSREDFGW